MAILQAGNLYGQNILSYKYEEITGEELKGRFIETDELINPTYLIFVDSMLIIRNYQTEYHFDMLCLKNGHIISKFCRKGRGPGEIIYPNNFQVISEKKRFIAYDVNFRKMNIYNFSAIRENKPTNYISSFKVDSVYAKYILLLEDGKYLCPLIGDKIGHKFCMLTSDGKFLRMVGMLPDIGVSFPTILSSNIFDYWVGINENRNRIILAYDHWDRLEVINTSGEIETIIHGPEFKKTPEFKVRGQNISVTRNNPLAYCSPCLTEKSFLVLYSGNSLGSTRSYNTAIHFDYTGKLLKKYNLKPSVKRIAVDWKNRIIYGISNQPEPVLVEYIFKPDEN